MVSRAGCATPIATRPARRELLGPPRRGRRRAAERARSSRGPACHVVAPALERAPFMPRHERGRDLHAVEESAQLVGIDHRVARGTTPQHERRRGPAAMCLPAFKQRTARLQARSPDGASAQATLRASRDPAVGCMRAKNPGDASARGEHYSMRSARNGEPIAQMKACSRRRDLVGRGDDAPTRRSWIAAGSRRDETCSLLASHPHRTLTMPRCRRGAPAPTRAPRAIGPRGRRTRVWWAWTRAAVTNAAVRAGS